MQRRLEILSVWLTVLVIAAGNAAGLAAWLHDASARRRDFATRPHACVAGGHAQRHSDNDRQPGGQEVAERGEGQVLLANPAPQRQLIDGRLKATGSPILEEPQADRHMLLALARSAVASSAGHVPLLRSTHLRI